MSELLPFPFCGGAARRFTIDEGDNFGGDVIVCAGICGCSSHIEFGRKENLVSLWNTRTPPASESAGAVAAMREAAARVAAILADNPVASDDDVIRSDDGLTFGHLRALRIPNARETPRAEEQFAKSAQNSAADAAPAVPDGWVLVPREPSEAMLRVGSRAPMLTEDGLNAGRVWSAMLAAARPAENGGQHRG